MKRALWEAVPTANSSAFATRRAVSKDDQTRLVEAQLILDAAPKNPAFWPANLAESLMADTSL